MTAASGPRDVAAGAQGRPHPRVPDLRALLAAIVDSSDDAIISKDLDGTITSWNQAAERMFGYWADDVVGKPVSLLFPEGQREEESRLLDRVRRGQRIDQYETQRRHKDGHLIDVSLTISPLYDADGRIVGASKIARDITDRRPQTMKAATLAAIVESSDDAIISKDLDGTITSWNKGAERVFGYKEEEMLGKPVTLLIPKGQEDEEPSILERIRNGERIDHYETQRRHKDGHLLHVSLTISPLRDDKGRIVGASKIARDITDRILLQGIQQEAATLRGAVAEAESFSYMVTHDLRTPLRAIQGFSKRLLERAPDLDKTTRESLAFIDQAASKMGQTIDGLLQLSRVSRAPMLRQTVDVSVLADSVLAELRSSDPHDVTVDIPRHMTAYGDPALIGILLSNVLGNAWKFTRSRPDARIQFGTEGPRVNPTYFVRDNGIGFAQEDAAKLFQPFKRLNPGSSYEGTGIGLATVRRIAERHGGTVWAEGLPGQGATIRFTLG